MTWNYDPLSLANDSLMQTRLLVGDTDVDDQLMQDEELEYYIEAEGGVRSAAIAALESLAAMAAKKVDRTIGPLSIKWSQRAAAFSLRAQNLRTDRVALAAEPYAGGLSIAEKDRHDQ
jgi:hypothetical protein